MSTCNVTCHVILMSWHGMAMLRGMGRGHHSTRAGDPGQAEMAGAQQAGRLRLGQGADED